MKTFKIRYTETWTDVFEVEAETEAEALEKFREDAEDGLIDFSRVEMMDSNYEIEKEESEKSNKESFLKILNREIEKTAKQFDEAKIQATKNIEAMTVFTATWNGAAHASNAENLTVLASKLETLDYVYRMYKSLYGGEQ